MRGFKKYIGLIFVIILSLGFFGCKKTGDYVVKIGTEEISKGEFMIYLYEQKRDMEATAEEGESIWEADFDGKSAEEVAKDRAVESLLMVKSAVKQAPVLNITLDEADKEAVSQKANEVLGYFTQEELKELSLDKEKIEAILEQVKLQLKVYDYITESYIVNEEEFNDYFAQYKAENPGKFSDYTIREMFFQADIPESKEKAQQAYTAVSNGVNFDGAAATFLPGDPCEEKIFEESLYGDESGARSVYELKEGENILISDSVGYYVIKLVKITPKDDTQLKQELKQSYVDAKKKEIYAQQSAKWIDELKTEKNADVWNDIKVS